MLIIIIVSLHTHTERERETETDRQTDRQTDGVERIIMGFSTHTDIILNSVELNSDTVIYRLTCLSIDYTVIPLRHLR